MEKLVATLSPYLQNLDSNTLAVVSIIVSAIGALLSLIVALMGVWFAVAQYRLKRSIKVSAEYRLSMSADYNDYYPTKIILQNLKDKSEAVFAIHIRLGNNTYITMESFHDSPLVIQPFETIIRNYKPVSFYGCNSYKVDINNILKNSQGIVVLTTNKGKYVTKRRKHYWNPVFDSLRNGAIAALKPQRVTATFPNGNEYTVPSNASFIVSCLQNDKRKATFVYKEKLPYKHDSDIFELTPDVLTDKQSLHEHLTNLHTLQTSHDIDLDSIEVTDVVELPDYKRLEDFYTKSTTQSSYSWPVVHVLGRTLTALRR
jgi:hypothetical protein